MLIPLFWFLVVANAAAFGTLAVGWWALLIVTLVGAFAAPARVRPLLVVPLGALLGWGVLLVRSARVDGFPALLDLLGKLLPVSSVMLAGATLVLAAALGLGGALIGVALRRPQLEGKTPLSAS